MGATGAGTPSAQTVPHTGGLTSLSVTCRFQTTHKGTGATQPGDRYLRAKQASADCPLSQGDTVVTDYTDSTDKSTNRVAGKEALIVKLGRPPSGDQPDIPPELLGRARVDDWVQPDEVWTDPTPPSCSTIKYDPYVRRQAIAHRRQREARRRWCAEHGLDPRTVKWNA